MDKYQSTKITGLFRGCVLLITLLMAALMFAGASAEDSVTWELDANGVLMVSGEGEFTENLDYDLRQNIIKVHYGPGISYISPGLFSYSYNLTEFEVDPDNEAYKAIDGVLYSKDGTELIECPTAKTGDLVIPEGVATICANAFVGNHLTSVVLPASLETIGSQAFWNSEYLTEITLPALYRDFSSTTFNRCQAMTAFTVAEGNTSYTAVDGILYSKDGTVLYRVPGGKTGSVTVSGVKDIYADAFRWCEGLTEVTLSEGVETIGRNAFNASSIQSISLPASLKTIQNGAFYNMNQLTNITYAGSVAEWQTVDIEGNNDSLQFQTVHCKDGDAEPAPITGSIGEDPEQDVTYTLTLDGHLTVSGAGPWKSWAFQDNKSIQYAVLEPGVTEIGWGAFAWATALKEITIPETVTEIQYEAFYACLSLESITIPSSVTSLGNEVFDMCVLLSEIHFGGTKAEWQELTEGTVNSKIEECIIYCTDGTIGGAEIVASGTWGDNLAWTLDSDGLLNITGEGAMQDFSFISSTEGWREHSSAIKQIRISEGVTSLGLYAFADFRVLESISLPDSIVRIKDYAINGCPMLSSITLPASLAEIGYLPFSSSKNLQEILVPEGNAYFTSVDGVLFDGNTETLLYYPSGKAGAYTVPDGVKHIGSRAFYWCPYLTKVVISAGVESIAANAFQTCNSLEEVVVLGQITEISEYAFARDMSLSSITLPASITRIGPSAFENSTSLTDVYFGGTQEQWEQITIAENNAPLQSAAIHFGKPRLLAPVLQEVHHGETIGQGADVTFEFSDETRMNYIEFGKLDENGKFYTLRWENDGTSLSVGGYDIQEPGTYQFRAQAMAQYFWEDPSAEYDDSEWTVYNFTVGDADLQTLSFTLSAEEIAYGETLDITVTPPAERYAVQRLQYDLNTDAELGGEGGLNETDAVTSTCYMGPGKYVYRVSGLYNGLWSRIGEFSYRVLPIGYAELPTVVINGEQVADQYTAEPGESLVIDVTAERSTYVDWEIYQQDDEGKFEWKDSGYAEGSAATFDLTDKITEEGVYRLKFYGALEDGWAYDGERIVTLTVTSGPVLRLRNDNPEINFYIWLPDDWERVWSQNYLTGVFIENYTDLYERIGGEPEFNLAWPDVPLSPEWNKEGWEEDGLFQWHLDVRLNEIPDTEMDVPVTIICTWGDLEAETVTMVHIKALDVIPQGTDLPEEIILNLGETFTVEPHILPAGCTIPGYNWEIVGNSGEFEEFTTHVEAQDTQTSRTYTTIGSGVYEALVALQADTVIAGRFVKFVVKDENGLIPASEYTGTDILRLPAALTRIEEEAFAGDTSLEAIDIPAGVTFIADNAFDGCGTVYVYTNDNPYVIEYVRNHDNLIGLK